MGAEHYPIPAIYLHLAAVMNYMNIKQPDKAEEHLLAAWQLARPDDLIEGFGEHHRLLGGMLAARGWTNPEIALHMNISVNTVKRHISQAMKKLQVKNRKDLKKYMLE